VDKYKFYLEIAFYHKNHKNSKVRII